MGYRDVDEAIRYEGTWFSVQGELAWSWTIDGTPDCRIEGLTIHAFFGDDETEVDILALAQAVLVEPGVTLARWLTQEALYAVENSKGFDPEAWENEEIEEADAEEGIRYREPLDIIRAERHEDRIAKAMRARARAAALSGGDA